MLPTTANVAPGLCEFASFLDTHPDVLTLRRNPQAPVHLSYILADPTRSRPSLGCSGPK